MLKMIFLESPPFSSSLPPFPLPREPLLDHAASPMVKMSIMIHVHVVLRGQYMVLKSLNVYISHRILIVLSYSCLDGCSGYRLIFLNWCVLCVPTGFGTFSATTEGCNVVEFSLLI